MSVIVESDLMNAPTSDPPLAIGRYLLLGALAAGGMGTVHVGRLRGAVGFGRMVAIKRLHAQLAHDPEFVEMLIDEARIASRLRHPNVVPTIDVVATASELVVVMELVEGENVATLQRELCTRFERIPLEVAGAIVCGVLNGLHEAHEAKDEAGRPLHIVHRDVSPQNVLVGSDGLPRLVDFGVAKAALRATSTRQGEVRGKVAYMPPEQLAGDLVDRRADVYGAAVVLWEMLAGRRLFQGDAQVVARKVIRSKVQPPSTYAKDVPAALDAIVMRGLSRERDERYDTALAMACAIEKTIRIASTREVAAWMGRRFGDRLQAQRAWVASLERRGCAWRETAETPDAVPVVLATQQETVPMTRRQKAITFGAAVCAAFFATALGAAAKSGAQTAAPITTAAQLQQPSFTPEPVEPRVPRNAVPDPMPSASAVLAPLPLPPPPPPSPPRRAVVQRAGAAGVSGGCSPPYVIDAEGVRVPKPACF